MMMTKLFSERVPGVEIGYLIYGNGITGFVDTSGQGRHLLQWSN